MVKIFYCMYLSEPLLDLLLMVVLLFYMVTLAMSPRMSLWPFERFRSERDIFTFLPIRLSVIRLRACGVRHLRDENLFRHSR